MKARDRSAGDNNEAEWKYSAAKDRARAIDELGDRRHLYGWVGDKNADCEEEYRSNLQISGNVIARRKQHPCGKRGGAEAVNGNGVCKLNVRERKDGAQGSALGNIMAHGRCEEQKPNPNSSCLSLV